MKKQPLKEKLKSIGGGHLLNESHTWDNRKFGEPLPTMEDYKKAHNEKHGITEASAKVTVGFSNTMGALYVSKGNQKTVELKKADVEEIIKQYKKFKNKMD